MEEQSDIKTGILRFAKAVRDFIDADNIRLKGDITSKQSRIITLAETWVDYHFEEGSDIYQHLKDAIHNYEERQVSVNGTGRKQAVRILAGDLKEHEEADTEYLKKMLGIEDQDQGDSDER